MADADLAWSTSTPGEPPTVPCFCGDVGLDVPGSCGDEQCVEDDGAPCCRAQVTAGRDSGQHEPGCPEQAR